MNRNRRVDSQLRAAVPFMRAEEEELMKQEEDEAGTGLRPGPRTETDPEVCVSADLSPADQTLSTIDSNALLTAVSPEEEERQEEEVEEDDDDDDDDDEGGEGVKEMKNSSCVYLERHRRKRITQSCSMLRRLLPTIHAGRVDMVTVLETTVAFLETVQELVPATDPEIQSQESREVGQKMAADQEKQKKQVNRRGGVPLQKLRRDQETD